MKINTNIQALNAYRNLSSNQFHTSKNLEKLSSGLRINRAADDAAGLAISEKMRAQIRGLKMAERNSMDGISMIQTAEGALTEVHAMLQRMRELAVQASNDTNTETDRKEVQKEINQLTSEINRIGNATEFNTKKLLNGGATKIAPAVDKEGMAISTGRLALNELTPSQKHGAITDFSVDTNSIAQGTGAVSAVAPNNPSVAEVRGQYTITIGAAFVNEDTSIEVGGVVFLIADNTGDLDTLANTTKEQQADALVGLINGDPTLSTRFDVSYTPGTDTITLIEKDGQATGIDLEISVIATSGGGATRAIIEGSEAESLGDWSFNITTNFTNGDTVNIGGETFTFTTDGTHAGIGAGTHVLVGADESDTATNLRAAIDLNTNLATRFEPAAGTGATIQLTESAGQATGVALADPSVVQRTEVPGVYSFDIETNFKNGDTIGLNGETITFTTNATHAGIATGTHVLVGSDKNATAVNLRTAIDLNADLSARFEPAAGTGATIQLTESANQATGTNIIQPLTQPTDIPGEYTITVDEMFTRGEKVSIAGVTLTAVTAGADPVKGQFNVGNTKEDQAHSIQNAIKNHPDLKDRFEVSVTNNVLSLKEKATAISGETLSVYNTGNATGTVFFDHQVKSVEAVAPIWDTGGIDLPNTGQISFNGVVVDVAEKSLTDVIAEFNGSLSDFTFSENNGGITITGPTENAGTLNELRVHTTGDVTIANKSNDSSQLTTRGVTATAAKYVFDITSTFKENETITIGGYTFKGVTGAANATNQEFNVDGNAGNQAESLLAAIAGNPTLSGRYDVSLSGSKITLEEKVAGSEKADGVSALTQPTTALTDAIPGEFSFKIERSIVGQSFTIDGQEIKVVNDSVAFNEEVNNGTAMRFSENLVQQAANLREAINRNPYLNERYMVDGAGENIILTQRPGHESAELPRVMLGNTGTGDTFKSQLQIGPNQAQTLTFELNDMRAPQLGLSTTDPRTVIKDNNGDIIQGAAWNVIKDVSNGVSETLVEFSLDITSHEKATAAISVFDAAIERVNAQRASLGAFQNRLEHTINNLQVTHENLTASESRIRDADMALEMTEFTRNNILNQSATAMLAQANQLPQGVLQLLQ